MTSSNSIRPAMLFSALFAAGCLLGADRASAQDEAVREDPYEIVRQLDADYQAAVKANDAARMDQILAHDFELVLGDGRVVAREQLLQNARERKFVYEHQDESQKTVRILGGETATVTALLWLKGTHAGEAFDYKLWYTDVYVRRPEGWKYVLGQASLRLPAAS
jgi:ketosteroid isomerase-like protein